MYLVIVDRIAGRYYRPGPFAKGDVLKASQEPENKRDPMAIQLTNVETGRMVGYVPKSLGHIIYNYLEGSSVVVINALSDLIGITLQLSDSKVMESLKEDIRTKTDTMAIEIKDDGSVQVDVDPLQSSSSPPVEVQGLEGSDDSSTSSSNKRQRVE